MLLFLALDPKKDTQTIDAEFVYHAANPNIPGRIVEWYGDQVKIVFTEPVTMPGNPWREASVDWVCSLVFCFATSAEAWEVHPTYLKLRTPPSRYN